VVLMGVYRSPSTDRPVTRAGLGYAALWVVVIGARAAFSYGSYHWFSSQLGTWMVRQQVDTDAITNTLILMAVVMVLTRTIAMGVRGALVPPLNPPAGQFSAVSPRAAGSGLFHRSH
jgi:hypothetical protein